MENRQILVYLAKRHLQVVTNKKESKNKYPEGIGSGFFLDYKGENFFVTADHVVNTHEQDEQTNKIQRILDTNAYVAANLLSVDESGRTNNLLVTIQHIYYFDELKLDEKKQTFIEEEIFDGAFCKITGNEYFDCCVTFGIDGYDEIKAGEKIIHFNENDIIEPQKNDSFFIFGNICPTIYHLPSGEIVFSCPLTFKTDLKYEGETSNYYILKNDKEMVYKEWGGLSGSPVINQDGKLIGIACAIEMGGHKLWVKKIQRMLPLMEGAILTDKIEQNNK